jgi:hypothetical protein
MMFDKISAPDLEPIAGRVLWCRSIGNSSFSARCSVENVNQQILDKLLDSKLFNRREHTRIAANIPVEFAVRGLPGRYAAICADISRGGFLLLGGFKPHFIEQIKDKHLTLNLEVESGEKSVVIACLRNVISRGNQIGLGCEFVSSNYYFPLVEYIERFKGVIKTR